MENIKEKEDQNKRLKKVLLWILILGVVGIAYAVFVMQTGFGIRCPFRELTGWLCPGCGATHMCLAIIQGNIWEAYLANKALFMGLPTIIMLVAIASIEYIRGEPMPKNRKRIFNIICIILIIQFLIWGITRNILEV